VATSPNTAAPLAAGEPAELPAGTLVEGRYRVIRLIGVGGTGVVYEVEHVRTVQRLALKTLLDPQHAPRLEQEARALARLRSQHVVKVADLGQSEAGPYFVMTLLEGKNLRDVLESKVKLGVPFVANLALQVTEGLDEAHLAGLVHRDLKPDNLHIGERRGLDGKPERTGAPHDLSAVTVFDFGVVKLATAEANSALTRTGSTVGTPYYMSLEQLRGSGTVDAISDVYALSVVLYECLAGVRPFEAGTLGDLIFAICSTSPTHLSTLRPDVPKELADIIMRGLSREKSDRPQTMRDLARAFEPHGDPAFTLWLRRPEPPRAGGADTPARSTAPATAGVPRVGGARLPFSPSAAKEASPPPRVPKPTQKLGSDKAVPPPAARAEHSTDPDPTHPEDAPTRDTPTEMYVRDIHGNLVDARGLPAPAIPTLALPLQDALSGAGFSGSDEPSDKTAVLELPPSLTGSPAAVAMQAALQGGPSSTPSPNSAAPTFGAPPLSQSGTGMPAMQAPPSSQIPSAPSFAGAASSRGSLAQIGTAEPDLRSPFVVKLDELLTSLGKSGNQFGAKVRVRFRAASQEQQIVIVVVVTAVVALLVVAIGYALF